MNRERFEQLVSAAIAEMPEEFRKLLENVAIIVEDRHPDEDLFGLYEGTPLPERGAEAPLYPDRIWIFQEPIEQECEDEDQVKEEIRLTIMHEVAHFFGIDDDALDDMGY